MAQHVEGARTDELNILKDIINAREKRSRDDQLKHARPQGEDLLRAKKLAGHGNWERWCAANLDIGMKQINVLVQREQELCLRESSEVLGTMTLSNHVVQVAAWPSTAA